MLDGPRILLLWVAVHLVLAAHTGHGRELRMRVHLGSSQLILACEVIESELERARIALQADADGDGRIDADELLVLEAALGRRLLDDIAIAIDGEAGRALPTQVRVGSLDADVDGPLRWSAKLVVDLTALAVGGHRVEVDATSLVDAAAGHILYVVPVAASAARMAVQRDGGRFILDFHHPTPTAGSTPSAFASAPMPASGESSLLRRLRTGRSGLLPTLLCLVLAFGFGMVHALSPGHGKTLVASYLVGEHGTVRDAVILGLVVTSTHVFAVVLLGLASLFFIEQRLPERVLPWLSLGAGLAIAGLGWWLLARRAFARRNDDHGHHDHGHHDHGHRDAGIQKPAPTNATEGMRADGPNPVATPADHEEHGAHHHALDPRHSHSELLWLGVMGGIVPCPSALVVLLTALAVGRVAFGLGLIAAFSLGLASVLVFLGILCVRIVGRVRRVTVGGGFVRALPILSATAITIVGLAIFVSALLELR